MVFNARPFSGWVWDFFEVSNSTGMNVTDHVNRTSAFSRTRSCRPANARRPGRRSSAPMPVIF